MNILYIFSDMDNEFNCSWHRCYVPGLALRRAGRPVEFIHSREWTQQTPEAIRLTNWADLILFQRNVFPPVPQLFLKYADKPFCVDLDDGYHQMTPKVGIASYRFWIDGVVTDPADNTMKSVGYKPLEVLTAGVKIAGALSSPSALICNDWSEYAQTYVIPNFYDPRFYARHAVYKEPGMIHIGWGGSAGHIQSWTDSGLIDALLQIVKEYPQVLVFMVGDERVQIMLKALTPSRKRFPGWVPNALWSKMLSYYDIGLVPLAGDYDDRRSCLKSMEYTEMGIPWIGSDAVPNRFIPTGRLVANTKGAWYEALKEYVEHFQEKKAEIQGKHEEALKWVVDDNVETLEKIYEQIVNDWKGMRR